MTGKMNDNKSLWWYFGVTFAFSWIFWIPNALAAQGISLPSGLSDFLAGPFNPAAFGPLFAALLLTYLQQGGKGILQLLQRGIDFRFKKVWLAAILFLPLIIFSGSIFAAILVGKRPLDLSVISNPPYALVAFFVILFTAGPLQEEFGWRGYALPRLQSRFSALTSSIILGFFWWLWHLPAVFIPGRFMADNLVTFFALLVVITLTSILFTWLFNHTNGSILATLLMHTSMNWSIWLAMPSMKMDLLTIGFMSLFLAIAVFLIVKRWGAANLRREKA
ncbi:type II CAAX endopeptidase family protein [Levilinea saccharolytica]|uniref:type II CAAX endopeptidase family protein n=1 Tax=Levilinea saccharolytica TaxID=229921 RepID=UPI000785FE23|nr:type II CAAX endopeptidase family protein [Levilinea saccharolytica]GAP18500.1 CAAX protease self-immunity [Levilinea saccharolytica]